MCLTKRKVPVIGVLTPGGSVYPQKSDLFFLIPEKLLIPPTDCSRSERIASLYNWVTAPYSISRGRCRVTPNNDTQKQSPYRLHCWGSALIWSDVCVPLLLGQGWLL